MLSLNDMDGCSPGLHSLSTPGRVLELGVVFYVAVLNMAFMSQLAGSVCLCKC